MREVDYKVGDVLCPETNFSLVLLVGFGPDHCCTRIPQPSMLSCSFIRSSHGQHFDYFAFIMPLAILLLYHSAAIIMCALTPPDVRLSRVQRRTCDLWRARATISKTCCTHTNSKHWVTTSFLGGRCRKAMLGVWCTHRRDRHWRVLTRKNWKTILHPVAPRSRTLATGLQCSALAN